MLGASVTRAQRAWGSYSPSPTYRLVLADGSRAFFKGDDGVSNAFSRAALEREERVYQSLSGLISPWAPAFHGSFREGPWRVLLLEDLGPKSVPPWTPGKARGIAHAFAGFHESTRGVPLPEWLPPSGEILDQATWRPLIEHPDGVPRLAGLAGAQSGDALVWLQEHLPLLCRVEGDARKPSSVALLHFDTRSDNLRFHGGRLRLVDWPFARAGAPELDVAAFAESVGAEGGPHPERVVQWYRERAPLDDELLTGAIVAFAAFLGRLACQPELPGLPRLRGFQRRQFETCLEWALARLRMPCPSWLASIAAK